MDGGTGDVELLLASVKQELAALRDDPRFREPEDGKRGTGLYEHVVDLLDASEHRMESPPEAEASAEAREAFARTLRESISVLRDAHLAIPWLEATRSPNVNLGSLYMSEEYTELLVGTEADLVVVPDRSFMYSTVSWPFLGAIKKTLGFKPRTKRWPIIVNYPLSDSDRLLLHPLFAHEIGHATVYKYNLIPRLGNEVFSDEEFSKRLEDEATYVFEKISPGYSKLKLRQMIRERMRSWVKELLCDHLAVEASGPAYLWAMAAFGLPLNRSEPSDTHPPTALRVKLALDLLEINGWGSFCEEAAPRIMAMLNEVREDATKPLEHPWEFLRQEILDLSEWLRNIVIERVGDGSLKSDVGPEATEAAALLERLILPVGPDAEPFAPRAIVIGGWVDGIRQHGDTPEGLLRAQSDWRLQNLVGKGIEMSTVLKSLPAS